MSRNADVDTDESTAFTEATKSWSDISYHVLNSYLEANRAVIAALGFSPGETSTTSQSPLSASTSTPTSLPSGEASGSTLEPPGVAEEWETELSVDTREELGVGEYVRFSKVVTDGDVHAFAGASGDTNRLHLDDDFAAETRFGGRIAHGTLVSGLISAALARLPGLTIYLSQDLEFRGPVEIDSTVTAECEIVEDLGGDRYRLRTQVTDADDEVAIDGEAVVLIDDMPEE
ncbi:acyl dehydratase [Halobacteriales archaeon QS_3_64_16]|nr:MAG: acyl dehydratase [Halobacteriales archaeon QS_3_64_16]